MTLPFMTHFPMHLEGIGGQPTYFVEKIWNGLLSNQLVSSSYFPETLKFEDCKGKAEKLHTFRGDPSNLWKPGKQIHFVINNRTPKRLQFLPTIPCISTQEVFIHPREKTMEIWRLDNENSNPDSPFEGWWQDVPNDTIIAMAINDGFDNTDDFFNYFGGEWGGKIIHWTNLKY